MTSSKVNAYRQEEIYTIDFAVKDGNTDLVRCSCCPLWPGKHESARVAGLPL